MQIVETEQELKCVEYWNETSSAMEICPNIQNIDESFEVSTFWMFYTSFFVH